MSRSPARAAFTELAPVAIAVLAGFVALGTVIHLSRRAPAQPPRPSRPSAVAPVPLPPGARESDTSHFRLYSTADIATTAEVSAALESLYAAYAQRFPVRGRTRRHEVVLYRDRSQFKRYNRSSPWAEACYREPRCHAYADNGRNPYHWMLHEATHQLAREASGFRPSRWANEGLATYFGASRIIDGRLVPGTASGAAYPVWWVSTVRLSGDLHADAEAGRFVRLGELLDSDGVDIAPRLNAYYVGYWSLVHFLMHAGHGHHAHAFARVLAEGGTREAFERLIGPVPDVERAWYAYFLRATEAARSGELTRRVPAVPDP